MSSCLSGGGRAYGFDLEIVKSPLSSTITSQTSSPSLSESSNFSNTISTRKARTPRKRPNQTYNEAAALLSTACPNIFSPKNLSKPFKFSKPHDNFVNYPSPELLLPFRVFDNSGYLIHQPIPEKPNTRTELKVGNFHENSQSSSDLSIGYLEDFDADSILDEEIEEGGIDSIMGNLSVYNNNNETSSLSTNFSSTLLYDQISTCYGYPMGLGLGTFSKAFRHVDEGEWWRCPQINIAKCSPKLNNKTNIEKKKKKVVKGVLELKSLVLPQEKVVKSSTILSTKQEKEKENEETSLVPISNPGLLLKLDFEGVVNEWSDRKYPFPDEVASGLETARGDLQARLALIDLFSENGKREARVLRYKEKRRTRLFSKKIRYQVRKENADQRPRMKGRFVRRPDSP